MKQKKSLIGVIILIIIVLVIYYFLKPGYQSVIIGQQEWMTKNLDVSAFSNGDPIPVASTAQEWSIANATGKPVCCYYSFNPSYSNKYGKLYNWYAVNDPRGLAPKGWHIPTNPEWSVVISFLGGAHIAGAKMKTTGGWDNNGNGTNESGFNALPGGRCLPDGGFEFSGNCAWWWSNSEKGTNISGNYILSNTGFIHTGFFHKEAGLSVRCIKD